MNAKSFRIVVIAIALGCCATAAPADSRDELQKLAKQFGELYGQRQYRAAEPIAKQMVEIAERSFKDNPEIIAKSLNVLASLYSDRGRYADAEPLAF